MFIHSGDTNQIEVWLGRAVVNGMTTNPEDYQFIRANIARNSKSLSSVSQIRALVELVMCSLKVEIVTRKSAPDVTKAECLASAGTGEGVLPLR